MKRTRLRKVSARKVAQMGARERCRRTVLARDGHKCRLCGNPATDVHELLSQARGGDPTDPDNAVALCNPCHINRVHGNPRWATEAGLLVPSWEGGRR